MKKLIILALGITALSSCSNERIKPSGNVITMERTVADFSKISVASGINASVTMSGGTSLSVTADDNVEPYVETLVEGGTLLIRIKKNTSFKGSPTLRVAINVSEITEAAASGGSSFTFSGNIEVDSYRVALSGGSRYTGGGIAAENLTAILSGGSELQISGDTQNAVIVCSGGSKFGEYDFQTQSAEVELSGGSEAMLRVNSSLSGSASGGSRIYYKGNPATVNVSVSGGSEVTHI